MRGLGPMPRIAAAVVVALLATACGGDDSSGLATLEGTVTTSAAVDPEAVEPVSEPTAATQAISETAETIAPVSSVEADAGTEAAGAAPTAEPEDATGGEPAEPEDATGGEPTEPEDATGGESTEPESTTGRESVEFEDMTDEERLLAFAECMRENGVDFPDPIVEADGTVTFGFRPGSGGGGLQRLRDIGRDPDTPAARAACEDLIEGLAFGGGQGGFDLIEIQDTLLEFAQCMRDNGVDMGDPDLSRFGPGGDDDGQPGGPFGVIDVDDPDFAAAFEVCQQQLPLGRGPRVGGGG